MEPIAVVGLDLKFPGDATDPNAFFDMLLAGGSALSEIPPDRFNLEAFHHPDPERAGTLNVRSAHFLKENIAAFDAPFFSITPAEAAGMDPQQRGLLESTYKALENAGMPLRKVTGSDMGVFVGCFTREYEAIQFKDPEVNLRYIATGTGTTMLANRLSYFYDFRGPSITLDTACSSSLTACHLACSSLRQREASAAIVAGCNLFYNPDTVIPLTSLGFLSPDGKCYSFDHRANGYSRGEGFGLLVLKRVEDAIRDGDTIRAVIRGSSSNQDGSSPGITQPTPQAQEALIRAAYRNACLDLNATRYFEAHGTGTPVGDPIEASAIGAVFAPHRSVQEPIYVGAVKTNVGHLEGSAGIAGLLKAILVLERGIIPPNIHFEAPNPKIPVDEWGLSFPTASRVWPAPGLRRASVNAFGYGGSNAHVVVDDALHFLASRGLEGNHHTTARPVLTAIPISGVLLPPPSLNNGNLVNEDLVNGNHVNGGQVNSDHVNGDLSNGNHVNDDCVNGNHVNGIGHTTPLPSKEACGNPQSQEAFVPPESRRRIFTFSSSDEAGAKRLSEAYHDHFCKLHLTSSQEQKYMDDLSYTLICKRTRFPWSFNVVAGTLSELVEGLKSPNAPTRHSTEPRLGLVFTGQGAQWHAMGRELLSNPMFELSIIAAEKCLYGLGCHWSMRDVLLKNAEDSPINRPEYSQPICTALQVALVDVLKSYKTKFSAIVGHSSGEIGAAYAAGAISCNSAWSLAYHRGMQSAKLAKISDGAMLAVSLSSEEASSYLKAAGNATSTEAPTIACVNSPRNVTISGPTPAIVHLRATLDTAGVTSRRLQVENAYHSSSMQTIAKEYSETVGTIHPGKPDLNVTFYSSLKGQAVQLSELQDVDYWVQNLVSPVLFSQALAMMCAGTTTKARKIRAASKVSPITDLLEVGPHSALKGPIREILEANNRREHVAYESILKRNKAADYTALSAIAWLHSHGYDVDLAASMGDPSTEMLVDLPSYPFNHSQVYWNESRLSKGYRFRKSVRHELLGAPVPDWNFGNAVWRNYLRVSESPWIRDHRITGSTIYPAAGMLVMAVEAARQLVDPTRKLKAFNLRNSKFSVALRIPLSSVGIETHFWLRPCYEIPNTPTHTWNEYSLSSHDGNEWREHCRGYVVTEYEKPASPVDAGREEAHFTATCSDVIKAVEASCPNETSFRQLYEHLSTVGLDFGLCFRTMRDVKHGKGFDAVATVEAPNIAGRMPREYVQPHLIHPTTLDGILQSIIVALTKGGRDINQVMVPSEISDLWISANGDAPIQHVSLAVQARFFGMRQAQASIVSIDKQSSKPAVTVKGFNITQIAKDDSQEESARGLCFNVTWKPDPTYFTQETANSLILKSSEGSGDIARMKQLIEEVETLCFLYIRRYMDKYKHPNNIDSTKPHYSKYIAWMYHQLDRFKAGAIPHSSPSWSNKAQDDHYIARLEERIYSSSPEGRLCVTVGRALPDILSGKVDALELLFKDQLVENVYRYGAGAEIGYERMNTFLDSLAHQNPALKILEIGAGTGGATKPVLQCLASYGNEEKATPRFSRYDFTDISIGFFEKAKEKFAESAERMTFRALNVEGDLAQQGFDKEQYDVVIAANVIHATKSLQETLSNVRKMMKPGGKLILYEMTNTHMIRTGFAFGLLPGWWLSQEDYRQWGPLAQSEDWSRVLQKSGFSGVDIDFLDFPDEKSQLVSVLVASVPGEDKNGHSPDPAVALVLDQKSVVQKNVGQALQLVFEQRFGMEPILLDIHDTASANLKHKQCIFLGDLDNSFLEDPTAEAFEALKHLTATPQSLLWLTQGGGPQPSNPKADLATGFARCIRAENPAMKFVTLSLSSLYPLDSVSKTVAKILDVSLRRNTSENSFYEQDGIIYVGRVVEEHVINKAIASRSAKKNAEPGLYAAAGRPLHLTVGAAGLLDTLQFEDDPVYDQPIQPNEVEVEIKATGLNMLDIMVALGRISGEAFGQEGAGVVTRTGASTAFKPGDRVCGLLRGTFKTYARADHQQWSKMPDNLSFATGAALPVVYCTAYYALHDLARIQEGETVLIHWGAGGVGQAAIQLALLAKAKIIATVGSIEKRDFLRDTYGIPESHILASRDLSFAQGVMRLTNGKGVDVVVNSMSGQGLRTTWECIAPFGRFVEIGKVDIYNSNSLPMNPFKKNVTFSFVDVGLIATDNRKVFRRLLRDVLRLAGEKKITEAKPLHIYSYEQIQEAFRIMQSGSHIGKFVLEPRESDTVPIVPTLKPSYSFDPEASYLITGGMGGLGRSMAKWMASRGAKNIILLSRSGLSHPAASSVKDELDAAGVTLAAPKCDVSDKGQLERVVADCLTRMPAIKGAILGAMVLKDAIFANMSIQDYQTAVAPKVRGSWNIHKLLPQDLDFFILLSSASGIVGNRGQSNYCVGNTFQDALGRHRVSKGLKATALDLGMILSVGFAAENQDSMANLRQAGFNAMREDEYLAMLDALCNPHLPPATPVGAQVAIGIEIPEALRIKGIEEPAWMQDPLFNHLFGIRSQSGGDDSEGTDKNAVAYGPLLAACGSAEEAADIVTDAIVQKLCKALLTPAKDIDASRPLHTYGVDSLVAVELRTWFMKVIGADVAIFDIMGGSSLQELAALAARRSSFVAAPAERDGDAAAAA